MVGMKLKQLGEEWGMTTASGMTYGVVNGYMVTMSEGMGYKQIDISAFVPPETRDGLDVFLQQPDHQKNYWLKQALLYEQGVRLTFLDNPGTMKRLRKFLDMALSQLKEAQALGADFCVHCHRPIGAQQVAVKAVNGVAQCWHIDCTRELYAQAAQETMIHETENKQYGRGFLGALLGALVGAIPWAIIYYFGWIVGWLGFLIGILAKKGYELMGGRVGKAKFWIVLCCTLLGVLVGQFGGDAITIVHLFAEEGVENWSILDIPSLIAYLLLNDSEYLVGTLGSLFMGVLFSVLGTYGILKEIRTENREAALSIVDLA